MLYQGCWLNDTNYVLFFFLKKHSTIYSLDKLVSMKNLHVLAHMIKTNVLETCESSDSIAYSQMKRNN